MFVVQFLVGGSIFLSEFWLELAFYALVGTGTWWAKFATTATTEPFTKVLKNHDGSGSGPKFEPRFGVLMRERKILKFSLPGLRNVRRSSELPDGFDENVPKTTK